MFRASKVGISNADSDLAIRKVSCLPVWKRPERGSVAASRRNGNAQGYEERRANAAPPAGTTEPIEGPDAQPAEQSVGRFLVIGIALRNRPIMSQPPAPLPDDAG